jgi:hypothetical protein
MFGWERESFVEEYRWGEKGILRISRGVSGSSRAALRGGKRFNKKQAEKEAEKLGRRDN